MEKLFSPKITKKTSESSTQKYLDIAEVKENTIILKNGSIRAVLAVSSINFDLKSSEEQENIIHQYQNFLNSIDFPVQIIINSRKLNIEDYLEFIEKREKQQPSEALRLQISEYINFIKELVSISNIMEKGFYIVVPFSPIENKEKGFFSNVMSWVSPQKNILEKRENFETYRNQLIQRIEHIRAGLGGIGLRLTQLKTQEIIELLYNAYNPTIYSVSQLEDVSQLEINNKRK